MKRKKSDVFYCGVSEENVKTLTPILNKENFEHLKHWLEERYRIRYKKDVLKERSPWTEDEVLQMYRFTNVKRIHDRETIWLLDNVLNNEKFSMEEKIWNTILFRMWNKSETMEIFGGPFHKEEYMRGSEYFRPRIDTLVKNHPDKVWYTGAFNTGGAKRAWQYKDGLGYTEEGVRKEQGYEENMPLRMFFMMDWVNANNMVQKVLEAENQEECFNALNSIPAVGPFLAYQMFIDLSYMPDFPFSEEEFTSAGPGCRRGIDDIVQDRNGLSYEEVIFWFRDNQVDLFGFDYEELMKDLPKEEQTLTLANIENSFCEISKYIKAVNGTGRPRVRYREQRVKSRGLF